MWKKRIITVYSLLMVAWMLFAVWQIYEHSRMKQVAREALLSRARDISTSLGVVIRSESRFGIIRQSRLEAALKELVQSKELHAVALLNASGQVVASAGQPINIGVERFSKNRDIWTSNSVIMVNLVDLGTWAGDSGTTRPTPIIMRRSDARPPDHDDEMTRPEKPPMNPEPERSRPPRDRDSGQRPRGLREFGRPPWMTEEQYRDLLEKQGLHGFVIRMSISSYRAECARDSRLRMALGAIALVAAIGLGIAWRNAQRSARLRIRLLKASEMNTYLREMNIAAAGLAHETKNPLNIVRGQAQIISQERAASDAVRSKAHGIMEEVDRVTGRLNEFINYSKPPEPAPAPTNLKTVIRDVERTLESDMEDKGIRFEINGPDLNVQADESLLRQVFFNLLLNSIQAVDNGGAVEMAIRNTARGEASIEFRDNGCGVPPNARENIFRPYFTTREGGTGLGLAIVRQIVLAHQWEIEYIPQEKGSVFRITGLKIV